MAVRFISSSVFILSIEYLYVLFCYSIISIPQYERLGEKSGLKNKTDRKNYTKRIFKMNGQTTLSKKKLEKFFWSCSAKTVKNCLQVNTTWIRSNYQYLVPFEPIFLSVCHLYVSTFSMTLWLNKWCIPSTTYNNQWRRCDRDAHYNIDLIGKNISITWKYW